VTVPCTTASCHPRRNCLKLISRHDHNMHFAIASNELERCLRFQLLSFWLWLGALFLSSSEFWLLMLTLFFKLSFLLSLKRLTHTIHYLAFLLAVFSWQAWCLFVLKSRAVYHQFAVSEWLTHLAATLEVMGYRVNLCDISKIYFLESIQSWHRGTLNGLCDIAEFNVVCNVSSYNWYEITVLPRWPL